MPRKTTPSFITELPLRTTASDARELKIRFDLLRQVYNAVIGESLRRLDLMRESKAYRAANALKVGEARTATFKVVNTTFGFLPGELQKFAQKCQKGSPAIAAHTGSHDLQTTALRAFKAVQRHAFGKGGRPKFKKYRELQSVEGKDDACILFRAEGDSLVVKWAGLTLPAIFDPRDEWQRAALTEHRTKYVRILWREMHGKIRWYAQLIQEGLPPAREGRPVGNSVVGLDMGPSTIAAVSENDSTLEPLCPTVNAPITVLRRVARKMDRSRRATNPSAFNPDGTYKKGSKITVRSRSYTKLRAKKADVERRLAAERKRSHGELSNRVLAQGNIIKTENVSYKSWQMGRYGRSVGKRAPAMLVRILSQKAKTSGGSYTAFSTRKTKLSQVDHTTGLYTKKPLSQREHVFPDGSRVQRDLYSAYLARFVDNDRLDIPRASLAWAGAEPLLRHAVSSDKQGARGVGFGLPHAVRKNNVRAVCMPNQRRSGREVAEVVIAVAVMQRAMRAAKSERMRSAGLGSENDSG